MTPRQIHALTILKEHPGISANAFAGFYFTRPEQEYLFSAASNQGNGACRGKKAWLCAGSLLGKLCKLGLVYRNFDRYGSMGYHLTANGRAALDNTKWQ